MKIPNKFKLRVNLQNVGPLFLKVFKNKEILRNCYPPKEAKDMIQLNVGLS